ncbi:putative cyclin-D6-1 isoform X3 [Zingiber officinale]|uniref:putative cyclin-D6-1 isoform X3 n=1 Tax=Zingiber officinale TaxID=94328 RepID=UPI001C4CB48B|nr:putative cyclin-D6-1 isoform X3 [Zingiber officinale]
MEFDLENPLISCDDEQPQRSGCFAALFTAESDHMVSSVGCAVDIAARRDAVALVMEFGCTLDPLVAYLAINYIDRFLCRREISQEKPWIVGLLSVSCISLASKMKKSRSVLADLQGEGGIVFDAQAIRRMELLVLAALDWRMRSITPFSFLRFFVSFFAPAPAPILRALKSHASLIILKTQREVKMLRFKPSVLAAAALLAAAYELFPAQFPTFRAAVYSCDFVNIDELWECSHSMSSLSVDVCDAPASDTPVTVFGRHCSSSESEPVVGSSPEVGRELKKRRFYLGHAACSSSRG